MGKHKQCFGGEKKEELRELCAEQAVPHGNISDSPSSTSEAARKALESFLDTEYKGKLLRARMLTDLSKDLPSKHLSSRINRALAENAIFAMKTSEGTASTSNRVITTSMRDYFAQQYSASKDSVLSPSEFIHRLQAFSKDTINALNAAPCINEVEVTIKHTKPHSSPGPDGLPYRFYVASEVMLILITRLLSEVWRFGKISNSWLLSHIRPIWKEGKPKDIPSSYRPISLLNTDYKVFTTIYNNRLQPTLSKNIPISQTGFIKGRSTHMAALRLSSFARSAPYHIVLLDFEKAYDKVTHTYLRSILTQV
jgi:hypothetical protein